MDEPASEASLERLSELATTARVAVLCYEREHLAVTGRWSRRRWSAGAWDTRPSRWPRRVPGAHRGEGYRRLVARTPRAQRMPSGRRFCLLDPEPNDVGLFELKCEGEVTKPDREQPDPSLRCCIDADPGDTHDLSGGLAQLGVGLHRDRAPGRLTIVAGNPSCHLTRRVPSLCRVGSPDDSVMSPGISDQGLITGRRRWPSALGFGRTAVRPGSAPCPGRQ